MPFAVHVYSLSSTPHLVAKCAKRKETLVCKVGLGGKIRINLL